MKIRSNNRFILRNAVLLTLVFLLPWLFKDAVGIEHDTFFHLSRIQGLAESIQRFDFFPKVYPYKNNGFGYGSPMFYCELLLIPSALLYLLNVPLSVCYIFTIGLFTFLSAFFMLRLCRKISNRPFISLLITTAYILSNYRITDTYVRSSMGELMAMAFLPLLLTGIYDLLSHNEKPAFYQILLGLCGLVFTHNITFLFGCILLVLFVLMNFSKLRYSDWLALGLSIFCAFLFSAWYTLPMIEQLKSQEFYVDYYAGGSDLAASSMFLKQYFANRTVFGYSGNTLPTSQQMLINVGWFLTFAPLTWLFVPKEVRKKEFFAFQCMILGYVFMILPIHWIPWDYLVFLRVIQFPWRFMTLALPLLTVSLTGSLSYSKPMKNHAVTLLLMTAILIEGLWHLTPVLSRTFTIHSDTVYNSLIDGTMVDPYYSATYVRVECAGGDYIPIGSPDFRTYSTAIKDIQNNDLSIFYQKSGNSLSFTINEPINEAIKLPLSWYKGYQVYYGKEKVSTFASNDKMVSFVPDKSGEYLCVYEGTLLQKLSASLSLISVLLFLLFILFKPSDLTPVK